MGVLSGQKPPPGHLVGSTRVEGESEDLVETWEIDTAGHGAAKLPTSTSCLGSSKTAVSAQTRDQYSHMELCMLYGSDDSSPV